MLTVVLLTAVTLLYVILTTYLLHTEYYIIHDIPAPYHIYNTTRVNVHIWWHAQRNGVAWFKARTRVYAIDCIYLYFKSNPKI